MIADAGDDKWKVKGNKIDRVARFPKPGNTPTKVPKKTPAKHKMMFSMLNAVENPRINDETISIYSS